MPKNSNRATMIHRAAVPASDLVLRELGTRRPGATAGELAAATGLGKSTVGKALAAFEAAGTAQREAGGRVGARRLADRWTRATESSTAVTAPSTPTATSPSDATTHRLGKGELGAMVLDYLAAHSDQEVGPTLVARTLSRSQGAVANALTRLADGGQARLTCEAPRRYQYAAE